MPFIYHKDVDKLKLILKILESKDSRGVNVSLFQLFKSIKLRPDTERIITDYIFESAFLNAMRFVPLNPMLFKIVTINTIIAKQKL